MSAESEPGQEALLDEEASSGHEGEALAHGAGEAPHEGKGEEPGGDEAGGADEASGEEQSARQARSRLRWPVMLLAAAVVACLAIWQDTPSERAIEVRVAAEAQARQVQLEWLDGDGTLLRHSSYHFDGSAAERRIDSQLTVQPGIYRLNVRVRNARTERTREHRIDLRQDTPVTVFAP